MYFPLVVPLVVKVTTVLVPPYKLIICDPTLVLFICKVIVSLPLTLLVLVSFKLTVTFSLGLTVLGLIDKALASKVAGSDVVIGVVVVTGGIVVVVV